MPFYNHSSCYYKPFFLYFFLSAEFQVFPYPFIPNVWFLLNCCGGDDMPALMVLAQFRICICRCPFFSESSALHFSLLYAISQGKEKKFFSSFSFPIWAFVIGKCSISLFDDLKPHTHTHSLSLLPHCVAFWCR